MTSRSQSKFRLLLDDHAVRTVVEMGWAGVENGRLLALASEHFDAFVTVDKNLPYQQNLSTLPIAVVVLDAVSNEIASLRPLVPPLLQALLSLQPKTYAVVGPLD